MNYKEGHYDWSSAEMFSYKMIVLHFHRQDQLPNNWFFTVIDLYIADLHINQKGKKLIKILDWIINQIN